MENLPGDWLALAALVFLLGLKHGMDPDHLVTIDGMARFNAVRRPRLSRWSGLLFSLGHGAVVTLVAVIVATVARDWQAPGWLEVTGAGVSIAFMLVLAVANVAAVFRAAPGEAVPDRIIWGSDYPHLSFSDKVGSVELFNLLGQWADEPQRKNILVTNPQRLFDFSEA